MAVPGSPDLSQIISEFGGGDRLSNFYRGGGRVPNHSANLGIPTSGQLNQSSFGGTELNFTATVTLGYVGESQMGYYSGSYGSISRNFVGVSRSTTTGNDIVGVLQYAELVFPEFPAEPYLNYWVNFIILGVPDYPFFNSITIGGVYLSAASLYSASFDGTYTNYQWYGGTATWLLPTSGPWGVFVEIP